MSHFSLASHGHQLLVLIFKLMAFGVSACGGANCRFEVSQTATNNKTNNKTGLEKVFCNGFMRRILITFYRHVPQTPQ
jgi:hypothetical protein